MAELYSYLSSLITHWAEGYWKFTVAPEVLSYLIPSRWTQGIDGFIGPEARRRFYIAIALLGVFAAGYQAWSDEHQAFQSSELSRQDKEHDLTGELGELKSENQQLLNQLAADKSIIERLQTDLAERKPESPHIEPKPPESAFSSMSNARLREITIEHVKGIRALRESTDKFINYSNQYNSKLPTHEQWVTTQLQFEMFQYKSRYLAKSLVLKAELRKREPDYLLEMEPGKVNQLNSIYPDPSGPIDLDTIANDLDAMAQSLPPDAPR
jgi:hypothetical protein